MRPGSLHSQSAEENCPTENVSSLRSVKGATLPCDACASIPCGLAVRKQHEMLFAASKFESEYNEFYGTNKSEFMEVFKMKQKVPMICNIVSLILLIVFVIKSIVDYTQYSTSLNSAPFYLWVLVNALFLVIPAIILFVIGFVVKKKQ